MLARIEIGEMACVRRSMALKLAEARREGNNVLLLRCGVNESKAAMSIALPIGFKVGYNLRRRGPWA